VPGLIGESDVGQAATGASTLVIDDGGVGSLLACLLLESPVEAVAWFPGTPAPAREKRRQAVDVHVEWLEMRGVEEGSALESEDHGEILLPAIRRAGEAGIRRVVWPLHVGEDVEAMLRESERCRLARRLAGLDLDGPAPSVATPLLDLTDDQIADLLRDLRAPLAGAWWCWRGGEAACGRCEGCQRWVDRLPVLRTRGATPVVQTPAARPGARSAGG
jgi:hypothetical protein